MGDILVKLIGKAAAAVFGPSLEVFDGQLAWKRPSCGDHSVFEDLRRHGLIIGGFV
jgi:hypothetical protein